MLVKDIMTKDVSVLTPKDNLVTAAKLMNEYNIGCLPVCESGNLVGVVTDRDIVIRNIANGNSPQSTTVKDVMTSDVTVAYPEMNIQEVSELMAEKQVRRLPVVADNKVVGIVALKDVALNEQSNMEIADTIIDISR